jgi:hypothetical protein
MSTVSTERELWFDEKMQRNLHRTFVVFVAYVFDVLSSDNVFAKFDTTAHETIAVSCKEERRLYMYSPLSTLDTHVQCNHRHDHRVVANPSIDCLRMMLSSCQVTRTHQASVTSPTRSYLKMPADFVGKMTRCVTCLSRRSSNFIKCSF